MTTEKEKTGNMMELEYQGNHWNKSMFELTETGMIKLKSEFNYLFASQH